MRACGLNFVVVYFDVKTHGIWEGDVITRSEFQNKNIHFLGFWDIRGEVTLRGLILRNLEFMTCIYKAHYAGVIWVSCSWSPYYIDWIYVLQEVLTTKCEEKLGNLKGLIKCPGSFRA